MTYTRECGGKERPVPKNICTGKAGERTGRQAVRWLMATLLLSCAMGIAKADSSAAGPQPTAAMLEAVHGLVAFMSAPRSADAPRVLAAHGLCIVENFPPYVFCGPNAATDWQNAYRDHSEGESGLVAKFDAARDFNESGNRVYFSLPTTWTGVLNGNHFEEFGAWAFVLERDGGKWRVLGYGWGITSRTETPASQ
jgi:hypothetical protein